MGRIGQKKKGVSKLSVKLESIVDDNDDTVTVKTKNSVDTNVSSNHNELHRHDEIHNHTCADSTDFGQFLREEETRNVTKRRRIVQKRQGVRRLSVNLENIVDDNEDTVTVKLKNSSKSRTASPEKRKTKLICPLATPIIATRLSAQKTLQNISSSAEKEKMKLKRRMSNDTPIRAAKASAQKRRRSMMDSAEKNKLKSERRLANVTPKRAAKASAERIRQSMKTSAEKEKLKSERRLANVTPKRAAKASAERIRQSMKTSAEKEKLKSERRLANVTPKRTAKASAERIRQSMKTSAEKEKLKSERRLANVTPKRAAKASAERIRRSMMTSAEKEKLKSERRLAAKPNDTPRRSAKLSAEKIRLSTLASAEKEKLKLKRRKNYHETVIDTPKVEIRSEKDRERYSLLPSTEKKKRRRRLNKNRVKILQSSFGPNDDDNDDELAKPLDDGEEEDIIDTINRSENPANIKDFLAEKANILSKWSSGANYCPKCREKFLTITVSGKADACAKCCRHYKKCGAYRMDKSNNMDPGDVPDVLFGLTNTEELLISQCIPIMSICRLKKGGQFGYRGNIINLPQDVHGFCKQLPRKSSNISMLIVRKKGAEGSTKDFRVRRSKIYDALIWLKNNNKYYKDIDIDYERLQQLPEDGILEDIPEHDVAGQDKCYTIDDNDDLSQDSGISDVEIEVDEEELFQSTFVPMKINTETDEQIIEKAVDGVLNNETERDVDTIDDGTEDDEDDLQSDPFLHWPERDERNPINEFTTAGYIARAYPTLFPYGFADFLGARNHRVTLDEYFKHLMLFHGTQGFRFAKHDRFRYFALNTIMRHRILETGRIFVKQHPELDNLTVQDVKDMHVKDQTRLSNSIMRFCYNIRGGTAFWMTRRAELVALIDQMKTLPTFFFTISSPDLQDPDLHDLIGPYSSKNKAVNENPMLVDYWFTKKIDLLLKHVIGSKGLGAVDHWARYEYQHRGSVHIHGLLWMDDAPEVKDLRDEKTRTKELEEQIAQYFDKYISCVNPGLDGNGKGNTKPPSIHPSSVRLSSITKPDDDLINLLMTVQRHTDCRVGYCKKTENSDCRFGFPKELQEVTKLIELVDGATDNSEEEVIVGESTDDDNLVKDKKTYPRFELVHRRNDPVINNYNPVLTRTTRANTDLKGIIEYEKLMEYIVKYATKREPKSKTMCEIMQCCLSKIQDEKPITKVVQSLMMNALADRDFSAQETVHILMGWPLHICTRRFVPINLSGNREINRRFDSDGEILPNPIDKYCSRGKHLHELNLVNLYSQYEFNSSKKQFVKMPKTAIVRCFPNPGCNPKGNNYEKYCEYYLMRNKPFTSLNDLKGSFSCYADALFAFKKETNWGKTFEEELNEHMQDFDNFDTEEVVEEGVIDDCDEQHYSEHIIDDWMLLCQRNEIYEAKKTKDSTDWTLSSHKYLDIDQAVNFIRNSKNIPLKKSFIVGDPSSLNKCQKRAYDHVLSAFPTDGNMPMTPLRMIIPGSAGSGKSYLIHLIRDYLKNRCIVIAPTGKAASIIDGRTIHSAFHIPCSGTFTELSGERQTVLQEELHDVQCLIIDEMSMLGRNMLGKIDSRMRQAKPSKSTEPLGGCSIIILGDFGQLPPVADTPLFHDTVKSQLSNNGRMIYTLFDKVVILTQIVRQQGDTKFRDLLQRLRDSQSTDEDYNLLSSRFIGEVEEKDAKEFEDCMNLNTTLDKVAEENGRRLNDTVYPIAIIEAYNSNKTSEKASTDDACGISAKVLLRIGARIMLTANLWPEAGLCNGTIGDVVDIVYPNGGPPDLPAFVLCRFDEYRGHKFSDSDDKLVPIGPLERTFNYSSVRCTRSNVPTQLAWSMTVHKAQGLTLNKTVLDLGKNDFAQGMTFVACSRVRRLEDLLLIPFSKDRLNFNSAAMRRRQFEDLRLAKMDGHVPLPEINGVPLSKTKNTDNKKPLQTAKQDRSLITKYHVNAAKKVTSKKTVANQVVSPKSRQVKKIKEKVIVSDFEYESFDQISPNVTIEDPSTLNNSKLNPVKKVTSKRKLPERISISPKSPHIKPKRTKKYLNEIEEFSNIEEFPLQDTTFQSVNQVTHVTYFDLIAPTSLQKNLLFQEFVPNDDTQSLITSLEDKHNFYFDRLPSLISNLNRSVSYHDSLSLLCVIAKGDGHCFYRSVSLGLFGCDSYRNVEFLRKAVAEHCRDNMNLCNYDPTNPMLWADMNNRKWGGDREFYALSSMFNIRFKLLCKINIGANPTVQNVTTRTYQWIDYDYFNTFLGVSVDNRLNIPCIYITHCGENHFNLAVDFDRQLPTI